MIRENSWAHRGKVPGMRSCVLVSVQWVRNHGFQVVAINRSRQGVACWSVDNGLDSVTV